MIYPFESLSFGLSIYYAYEKTIQTLLYHYNIDCLEDKAQELIYLQELVLWNCYRLQAGILLSFMDCFEDNGYISITSIYCFRSVQENGVIVISPS